MKNKKNNKIKINSREVWTSHENKRQIEKYQFKKNQFWLNSKHKCKNWRENLFKNISKSKYLILVLFQIQLLSYFIKGHVLKHMVIKMSVVEEFVMEILWKRIIYNHILCKTSPNIIKHMLQLWILEKELN